MFDPLTGPAAGYQRTQSLPTSGLSTALAIPLGRNARPFPGRYPGVPSSLRPPSTHDTGRSSPKGSLRRRLWDLPEGAHCPVVGVCVNMASLRAIVAKHAPGTQAVDDYDLHALACQRCRSRCPLSQHIQKDLDTRYATTVRQSNRHRSPDELARWWIESTKVGDLAAIFWAAITHPKCDEHVTERLLRDIHMLQHQVGTLDRCAHDKHLTLLQEHTVLVRELAAVQMRTTAHLREKTARINALESETVSLRGEVLHRDRLIEQLRADASRESGKAVRMHARVQTGNAAQEQLRVIRRLKDDLALRRQEVRLLRRRLKKEATSSRCSSHSLVTDVVEACDSPPELTARFDDKSVLCVGGRARSVPLYRQWIEAAGGQFAHHDGGQHDNLIQLQAKLEAADIVICQTTYCSHNAYWQVKSHCKRYGKQCLFVESPSLSSLKRRLAPTQHEIAGTNEMQKDGAVPA